SPLSVRFEEGGLAPKLHQHRRRSSPIQPELDRAKHLNDQAVLCADTVERNPHKPLPLNDGGREEIPQLLRELFGAASVRKLDCDHTVDLIGGMYEYGSHGEAAPRGSQRAYAAARGR